MAKLVGVDDDKQNQLIQTLLEAIPGMIFHVKRDGTFLEFISSKNSKPLFPPEEFLGKKIIDMMPPEIAKPQMLKIEELFTTGEPQIVEYPLLESGEIHWYEARFTVSGEDTLVAVVRDITERKQAEEETRQYADKLEQRVAKRTAQLEEKTKELEQANSQLKRADQLKSVFLASMSHELRTPLNSIIGFTGILLMELTGKLNDEQKKPLKMVKNSADHLLNMINDILDISKIEAGRVDLSPEKFLLNDVINEVTEIFSNQAAQKGLGIMVNIPGEIYLFSDMRRIKQILINLVSNAVKFTNQGRITITSKILPDERIKISVADTGIGIKEESMDKLFNPFQQVDMNLTKQFEGTGLGLYLCKSLVTLLGGEISAQSQYKKGSVFTFILPLGNKEK